MQVVSSRNLFLSLFMVLGLMGCATHITKPAEPPQPAKIKLGSFPAVYMKDVSISDAFAESGANQKALNKINEIMFNNMKMTFPNLQKLSASSEKTAKSGLIIQPHIKEIKFIGGAARFWAGAMAGSSAVLLQTTFIDSKDNSIIANPEFYRAAGAYAGAWSMGGADNRMLEDIANDVVQYASYNR